MTSIANYLLGEGLDKTQYQILDQSFQSFNKRRHGNELSFLTDIKLDNRSVMTGQPRMEKCGIVVWFDRSKMEELGKQPDIRGLQHGQSSDLRLVMQALEVARQSGAIAALPANAFVAAETLVEMLQQLFEEAS